MNQKITYRKADQTDVAKLSILFKTVYIQTYGTEGISDEFANFIIKQFSIERLLNLITNNPDSILVAVHKNNLVGAIEIEFDKKCPINNIVAPELNKLYILEWFCHQGIGEKILELAETIVKSKGNNQMWLWVLETNTRAIKFYQKNNYNWIGKASFQMETNKYDNDVMLKQL
jgi:diamine N-acetyltransferase